MSEKNDAPDGTTPLQDFIFVRELSEVYLLLDHISGRWDKSLYRVQAEHPDKRKIDWVQKICEIGWPAEGSPRQLAEQASTLLNAKDRLNAAARPASGATVAFTLMVFGEDRLQRPFWLRLFRPRLARDETARDTLQLPGGGFARPLTRLSLARTAFPGLLATAAKFQWRIKLMVWMLAGWLLFTCLLSWNVAAGNLILSRLDRVKAERAAISRSISSAESGAGAVAAGPAVKQAGATAASPEPLLVRLCERPPFLLQAAGSQAPAVRLYHSADEIHLCEALGQNDRERAIVAHSIDNLLDHWAGMLLFAWERPALGLVARPVARLAHDNGVDEETLRMLTALLGNSVLPLCYGILGAGAAVVRDLWAKMRESTLSPRDSPLALGQLALGAVLGACIGLFIAPAGAGQAGGVVAATALTGSALSFIAGFGVEGVFVALEGLMRRVFNLPPSIDKK